MERKELTNLMEILVTHKYNELKDVLGVCTCERCKLDMMSYALNRLPARYVVSEKGEAMSKVDSMSVQFDSDCMIALTMAAKVVGEHPRHEEKERI